VLCYLPRMTGIKTSELRSHFLDFYGENGHTVVKSAPLIPANDPTLMFVNAGMVQFKDLFVGAETRDYKRATSAQKCMRVSGKHNDLEEVGRTARHHTLFEMLGNFSFGDYFKEEAITLAWQFLTKELNIDASKLWVTVFGGGEGLEGDYEARKLWKKISGLPEERILDMGMKDNFWAMGDTGPCGPCTEIHYDTGGDTAPTVEDFENGRIVEIWNNVFMQFERKPGGELVNLPKPSVDTGMGLERLATLMQNENSNYHNDTFMPLINLTSSLIGKEYTRSDKEDDVSMRVIADHARAAAFLVADGIQPLNAGRGYVMRRIMRRAIRHGHRLGFKDLFFHKVCSEVVREMGGAYPELKEAASLIEKVAELEETTFRRTLDSGLKILSKEITDLQGKKTLAGETVFKLYDTYGFPKDLTELIASENELEVDQVGFEAAMKAQKELSQGSAVGDQAVDTVYKEILQETGETAFIGYEHEDAPLESRQGDWRLHGDNGEQYLEVATKVSALIVDGKSVNQATVGSAEVILNPTPFYGESGGQVGDRGIVVTETGALIEIETCQKPVDKLIVCRGRIIKGSIQTGEPVWAGYQPKHRKEIRAHHSATHLLHSSLREVLGDHVNQAGSYVQAQRLRFDYSHFESLTDENIRSIENDANKRVLEGAEVVTEVLPYDEARGKGAIALFGEKYGDVVRVVTMGESVEFCGGTHAKNTKDLDLVLVAREEAIASGVRRIEAEVGQAARVRTRQTYANLESAATMLNGNFQGELTKDDEPALLALNKTLKTYAQNKDQIKELGGESTSVQSSTTAPVLEPSFGYQAAQAGRDLWQALLASVNGRGYDEAHTATIDNGDILKTLKAIQEANKANDKELQKLRQTQMGAQAGDMLDQTEELGGIKVLATTVAGVNGKGLRELADQLRPKMGSGILCLGAEDNGRASLLISVTKDLTSRFKAGDLMRELAPLIDGKGGGKPELAQGGGANAQGFPKLFNALKTKLSS
jgi:alanyl-tRNA synthetase